MYSNVLVPCDLSYEHETWLGPTIKTAIQLTSASRSRLTFLTVIPKVFLRGDYPDIYGEELELFANEKLQSLAKKYVPAEISVQFEVKRGSIASEIIHAARELPADVVVLASHGPILKDYLLGSNATHIALHVPCSVMIVRNPRQTAKE